MKKNKTAKTGIIVAILLLAVGFAAITTTLYINGTAVIKPDDENFKENVIFTDVDVDATAKAAGATATLSADSKTITFTTQEMKSIGDTAVLSYKIKNGSQYVARIGSISCVATPAGEGATEQEQATATANAADYQKYLTVTAADGLKDTNLIAGATSDTDTVTVTQKRSFVSETEGVTSKTITYVCTVAANALESE